MGFKIVLAQVAALLCDKGRELLGDAAVVKALLTLIRNNLQRIR